MSAPPFVTLPAGVRVSSVSTARGPLACLEAGDRRAARRTSLLVPGYTGSKEDFLATLPALAGAGYFVVALDQRGQHESAGPADPAAYSVASLGADVLDVVEALGGGPMHLLGHSFGGLVVREAVIRRPGIAATLTLLGSGPAAIGGQRAAMIGLMAPVLEQGGLPAVWAAMAAMEADDPGAAGRPPEVRAFLHRRFHASSPVGLEAMGAALSTEPDRVAELAAAFGGPVLVAHGAGDDAWPPAEQRDMAERLGARYTVVPDALHSPAAENPAATAALLAGFWTDHDTGSSSMRR